MKLKILTPEATKYKGDVVSLNIKTLAGEVTILDGHEPLISMFAAGKATIVEPGNKKTELEVSAGFLEMTPENELNVLTE